MFNTFTPSGRNDYVGHDTPELKDIMTKYRRELDVKKRNEYAKERCDGNGDTESGAWEPGS